jgi:hypothetical protein
MVWEDIDGNGSRDPFAGEMGLEGWSVQLFDATGAVIGTQVTDASGNYVFAGLSAGTYSVCVVPQSTYHQTSPLDGAACGGLGYVVTFQVSSFAIWATNIDFGEMLN